MRQQQHFGIKSDEGEENGWLVGCFSTPYMFSALGTEKQRSRMEPNRFCLGTSELRMSIICTQKIQIT